MLTPYLNLLLDSSPRQIYYRLRRGFKHKEQTNIKAFDDKHPCVFVLSTGRAGTQTLSALLGLANNIFAYHEPKPILYGLSKLSYQYFDDITARVILREAFLTARKDRLIYSQNCERGYVETSPGATFLGPAILDAVKGVRFIHIVRDPREVVRSGMRRKWYEGHTADCTRIIPRAGTEEQKAWNNFNSFQKNLWLWTETNRQIWEFTKNLPKERILLVRSEDIFSAYGDTIGKIFSFIGSTMPSESKIVHILGKKLNSQKTGSFPTPSDWTDDMIINLRTISGQTASLLGYSI